MVSPFLSSMLFNLLLNLGAIQHLPESRHLLPPALLANATLKKVNVPKNSLRLRLANPVEAGVGA